MGRATQEKIYTKLIRNYLRFNLTKGVNQQNTKYFEHLIACFEKKGENHPECNELRDKIESMIENQKEDNDRMIKQVKTYPPIFNTLMYDLKTKSEKKGQHNTPKDFYQSFEKSDTRIDI